MTRLLIAESGSTKTQWNLVDGKHIEPLTGTPGINPVFQKPDEIEGNIRPVLAGLNQNNQIDKICFFGAGCASKNMKIKIFKALFTVFQCNDVIIESDLIGACLGLAQQKPGIVGLLGTGSNSCLWDGEKIAANTPSLGYILGDEGGGASIGKRLISDFLKSQMPLELRLKFIDRYDVNTDIVVERVYQMQMPGRYLAGFAPFIEDNIEHEYCYNLIFEELEKFVIRNLVTYDKEHKIPLYFSGSIAYYHHDVLKEVCKKHQYKIERIVKEPIRLIADFFRINPGWDA